MFEGFVSGFFFIVCCKKCSKDFLSSKIDIRFSSEKTICPVLDYGICFEARGSFGAANIIWLGMDALR